MEEQFLQNTGSWKRAKAVLMGSGGTLNSRISGLDQVGVFINWPSSTVEARDWGVNLTA